MVTREKAFEIAKCFVKDVCACLEIDSSNISVSTADNIPLITFGVGMSIPQNVYVDPVHCRLTISNQFLDICCRRNGFTPLRLEIYGKVRIIYLYLHPEKIRGEDIVISSIDYASSLILLKGQVVPVIPTRKDKIISIIKEEFGFDVSLQKVNNPSIPNLSGFESCVAHLTDKSAKEYIARYNPKNHVSTVEPLPAGAKGTLENPFDNVYEAVDFIKKMEEKAHQLDTLLQDIENQQFFYDPEWGQFRIPWASPFVAQYANCLPARSYMVNQMAKIDDKGTCFFSFKPNLYDRKFLYRGQNDYYAGKPCVPNLFRDEDHNNRNSFIDYLIFSQEMEQLIRSHPLIRLLEGGVELLHDRFRFRMHYSGLAQHYYNKSWYLDLSSDLDVMKFFATTAYNSKTEQYAPYTKTDHPGVIYCYELQYPKAFQQHNGYALKTIGKQIFMRPGAQCGYLLEMERGVDFKTLPEVTAVYFKHDPVVSEEIFKNCNGGRDYFASDLLQHAWKNRFCERYKRRIVSKATAEYNARLNKKSFNEIVTQLAENNITIDAITPCFSAEELDMYYVDIRNGWWEEFCKDIHFYGAEDELYRQALKELPSRAEYEWAFKRK